MGKQSLSHETSTKKVLIHCIPMNYPLIHQSNNTLPYHFIHGFIQFLNFQLGIAVYPTAFRGDIHLSAEEISWMSQVKEITGDDKPFWIVVSGGKYDFTCKWWDVNRLQEVVDHFSGKIQFVQIGESVHNHPPLKNVIDLRSKTDLRQLIRLVYHGAKVLPLSRFLCILLPPFP